MSWVHSILLLAAFFLSVLLVAQLAWVIHNNKKFMAYSAAWDEAKARFDVARNHGNKEAMQAAYNDEEKYYAAEMRVHDDNSLPPWKWIRRWNHDYLKSESGVVIAEAAIIFPVLVFVALALIDIQWMTRTAAAVEYIVTETARCEALESGACTAPNSAQTYAEKLARNLRLDTNQTAFHFSAPPCSPSECDVSLTYNYKALGAWFPRITIQRTGSAAVAPPVGGQP